MDAIVPAILPHSRDDLEEKLARYVGIAETIQIDVVDGYFAEPASWPYISRDELAAQEERARQGGSLPELARFRFDIDLMVRNPETVIGTWVALGASRITVHVESTKDLAGLVDNFGAHYGHDRTFSTGDLSLGLALDLRTDVRLIEPFAPKIDYVQFMGIATIGKQGQPFDSRVLERTKAFKRDHPGVKIQVDGGVSLETTPALLDAGADRLIIGSALLNAPDLKREYTAFVELTEEHGLYT